MRRTRPFQICILALTRYLSTHARDKHAGAPSLSPCHPLTSSPCHTFGVSFLPFSRSGVRLASFIFTVFVVLCLWLPLCQLGLAALQSAWRRPQILGEVAPWNALPRRLLWNTLSLGVLTGILSAVLGVPVGIAIARATRCIKNTLAALCALPLALPPILVAGAWLEATRTPPARSMASLAATQASPWPPVPLASLLLALCFFPIVAFATQNALNAFSRGEEEAARLFGNPWQAWRQILAPLLWPSVAAACGLAMALAMWEIGAPDLLDARTYSVEIYRSLNAPDDLDAGGKAIKAALAGVPMLLLGALALWPAARARRMNGDRLASSDVSTQTASENSGRMSTYAPSSTHARRSEGRLALAMAAVVLLACPFGPLLVFARQMRGARVLLQTWRDNDREIWNTIGISTISALLLVTIAFVLVVSWRDWPRRAREIALAFCVSPLLIAPVLAGVALLQFWNRPPTGLAPLDWLFDLVYAGLPPTGFPLWDAFSSWISRFAMMFLGYATRFGPLAVLLLEDASRRVHQGQIEAARNLGASSFQALRTVWLRALAPFLAATFALLWALCASELATSVLVNQPGGQTLPVPIFNLLHIGSSEEVAALSLTLFALSGGAMAFAARIATKMRAA